MMGLAREVGERTKEARAIFHEKDTAEGSELSRASRQCFTLSCFFTEPG